MRVSDGEREAERDQNIERDGRNRTKEERINRSTGWRRERWRVRKEGIVET